MLYYSYPAIKQSTYGDYFTQLSRFIENIGEQCIEEWKLVEEDQPELDSPDQKMLN